MLKPGFAAIFFFIAIHSFGQQDYFILIQSDKNQLFYARLGPNVNNASDNGRLIIPDLKDSSYSIVIGFPDKNFPDQHFNLSINHHDRDLELESLGDSIWMLVDRQTQQRMISDRSASLATNPLLRGVRKSDNFSQLMAGVVNDSLVLYGDSLLESPPPVKVSPDSMKKANLTDSAASIPMPIKADSGTVKPSRALAQQKRVHAGKKPKEIQGAIIKLIERTQDNGVTQIYIDHHGKGKADTIQLTIPRTDSTAEAQAAAGIHAVGPVAGTGLGSSQIDSPQNGSSKKIVLTNSDCVHLATDEDVNKLKSKILAEKTQEEKMGVIKKYFKTKCFSSRQMGVLGSLFTDPVAKYGFYQAAYPFVSDPDQFPALASQFSDSVYVRKFKALIP
jgi:hypothetical protein